MVEEKDTTTMFKKKYKMRSLGEDGLNTVVSIPRIVLQREADKQEISLKDFLKNYRAVAQFNNIDGIHYTFEKVDEAK